MTITRVHFIVVKYDVEFSEHEEYVERETERERGRERESWYSRFSCRFFLVSGIFWEIRFVASFVKYSGSDTIRYHSLLPILRETANE